jgi:hypothetical protein
MNKKWVALRKRGVQGAAALGLHLLCNTYSRHNGTGGFIDEHVPEMLVGGVGHELAALLLQVGMFDAADGGWTLHDFDEYSDPKDPAPNRSANDRRRDMIEKRKEAGRLGGLAKSRRTGDLLAESGLANSPDTFAAAPSKKGNTAGQKARAVANASKATDLLLAKPWQTPSPVPVPVTNVRLLDAPAPARNELWDALARAADVRIVPTFVYRVGRRHYRVVAKRPFRVARTADRDADLRTAIERLAHDVEEAIRRDPFQWKRFEPIW